MFLRNCNKIQYIIIPTKFRNIGFRLHSGILSTESKFSKNIYNRLYEEIINLDEAISSVEFRNKSIEVAHNYEIKYHIGLDIPNDILFAFSKPFSKKTELIASCYLPNEEVIRRYTDEINKKYLASGLNLGECLIINQFERENQKNRLDNPIYRKIALREIISYAYSIGKKYVLYNFHYDNSYHLDEFDIMPLLKVGFKTSDSSSEKNRLFVYEF